MRWDIPIEKSLQCLSWFADKLAVQKPTHAMKPTNLIQGKDLAEEWCARGSLHSEGFWEPR